MGIDASTSTIAYAIIEYDNVNINYIHSDFYKPPKKEDIFEKLSSVRSFIQSIIDKFYPEQVALEDIILFMGGGSTAKTITSLAILNRTVGLSIYEKINKPLFLYNVMKIRHTIKKDKLLPSKEDIPNLVADILKINFPFQYKKNKNNILEIKEESYDIADAIACALCHAYIDRAGKTNKSQIKKKKNKRKKKI